MNCKHFNQVEAKDYGSHCDMRCSDCGCEDQEILRDAFLAYTKTDEFKIKIARHNYECSVYNLNQSLETLRSYGVEP